MQSRGISTVVTGLIALVAIVGIAIYFISGSLVPPNSSEQKDNSQSSQNPPTTSQSVVKETPRLESESFSISNVHTWVSSNGQTVTAFVIQNTGQATSISSIELRGIAVPQSNWYSCVPLSCGSSTNIKTELTPDYDPKNGINLASGLTVFSKGAIFLDEEQATIVYLPGAGSLQPIDAGKTYALQIEAVQASAVQQVRVVSTD